MTYLCEGMIDQNRRIGDDPAGHACLTPVPAGLPERGGRVVCPSCVADLTTGGGRVSFVGPPVGKAGQEKRLAGLVERVLAEPGPGSPGLTPGGAGR